MGFGLYYNHEKNLGIPMDIWMHFRVFLEVGKV
jgi:hypothetical protein